MKFSCYAFANRTSTVVSRRFHHLSRVLDVATFFFLHRDCCLSSLTSALIVTVAIPVNFFTPSRASDLGEVFCNCNKKQNKLLLYMCVCVSVSVCVAVCVYLSVYVCVAVGVGRLQGVRTNMFTFISGVTVTVTMMDGLRHRCSSH